ncbi:MAG: Nif3-like dinuclear metal center hexameric protein [Acidobacteriota bacterium]|nr:Nif3-like dinuclear metal center hexameric protein [Acidobacteriota bacterium]MDH3523387.1 Nif3-like dinuclear metal center hexameric protein [Acidobacteriota bacterium]
MTRRDELVGYLDRYLEAGLGSDYGPNGLQVEGRAEIAKVVTGVSACRELFERAVAAGADAILVHHGLFWNGDARPLVGLLRRRVGILIAADVSLIAYHLPLDRHPVVGNNGVAARRFGVAAPRPFGSRDGLPLGCGGLLPEPLAPAAFVERCGEIFGQEPLAFCAGPDPIRSVAFVSGAAERLFHDAIAEGYDAFVTGEASEWVMNVARESGTHFVAAGHYATERLGIAALGEHVAERFGVGVELIDVPNPV